MSILQGAGVAAVVTGAEGLPTRVRKALEIWADRPLQVVRGVHIAVNGLAEAFPTDTSALLLTTTNISDDGRVSAATVAGWLAREQLERPAKMLPPFGALGLTPEGLRLVADGFPFRPLYRCQADGWSAASTSALLLATMLGGKLSEPGIMLQSQLGWQLGDLTPFEGVHALRPGETVALGEGVFRVERRQPETRRPGSLSLVDGVHEASRSLVELLEKYLDETDSPTLQLTGGQDSRIVLSAIPVNRRRGLKAMTLALPGNPDARIAGEIAARYGLDHHARGLDGLSDLSATAWYARVLATARTHDCMSDPIARSVTAWAEESFFDQGERLAGLGGEIARGFYYYGRVRPKPVTRSRAERLAEWRMMANDAVEDAALSATYRAHARNTAIDLVLDALLEAGAEWFTSVDQLYLHRMRRWAGLGESTVSFQRSITNPMLNHRFVAVANALSPKSKRSSKFLAHLQMALDPELAALPLDDRPAPRIYAQSGPAAVLRRSSTTLGKLKRKASQRLAGARRPPPGSSIVSAKIAEHLRATPSALDPARASGIFDESWLDAVAHGRVQPSPSSLALLVNVSAALDPRAGHQ